MQRVQQLGILRQCYRPLDIARQIRSREFADPGLLLEAGGMDGFFVARFRK